MDVNHVGDVDVVSSVVPIRPVYLFAGIILGKLRSEPNRAQLREELDGGPAAEDRVLLARRLVPSVFAAGLVVPLTRWKLFFSFREAIKIGVRVTCEKDKYLIFTVKVINNISTICY